MRPLVIAFVSLVAQSASAQVYDRLQRTHGSFEAGVGVATIDSFAQSWLSSAAATVSHGSDRVSVGAAGSLSRFESGNFTGYATVLGRIAVGPSRPTWNTAIEGDAGTGAYRGDISGRYARAEVRVAHRGGVWGAVGMGRAYDVSSYTTSRAELGAAVRRSMIETSLSGTLIRSFGRAHGDVVSVLTLAPANVQLQLTGAARIPPYDRRFDNLEWWGEASGSFRVHRSMMIVISAANFPVDVERALPGVQIVSAGLRVYMNRDQREDEWRLRQQSSEITVGASSADGTRVITVHAPSPGAQTVEIVGSFTDWRPVALSRTAGDNWIVRIKLPQGAHRINVRIDGGAWRVPRGLPAANDDLGGQSGILLVP